MKKVFQLLPAQGAVVVPYGIGLGERKTQVVGDCVLAETQGPNCFCCKLPSAASGGRLGVGPAIQRPAPIGVADLVVKRWGKKVWIPSPS